MRRVCPDVRLSAFLDDELGEDEAVEVARHVASCDDCARELEALRRMRDTLRDLPVMAAPPDVLVAAADRAEALEGRRRRNVQLTLGLAAAAMLLLGTAWAVGGAEDGAVVPPLDDYVVDHVGRVGGGPMVTPVDLRNP